MFPSQIVNESTLSPKKVKTVPESPSKKFKLEDIKVSDSDTSISKNKRKADKNSDSDASVSKKKKKLVAPDYPPQTVQLYFLKNQYQGKIEDAKEAFKKLSKKEIKKVQEKVNEGRTVYTNLLREFVKTLNPKETDHFQEELKVKMKKDEQLVNQFNAVEDSSDTTDNSDDD